MSEDQIKALLREGVEAARAGDKATARDKFEQVTELDEDNERAWLWLASVVDTDEERRVCLSNVLYINPENERAQQMMAKLESKKRQQEGDTEVIPGVTRRQVMLIGGGGAVAVVLLVLIGLVLVISNRNTEIANANATAVAVQAVTNTAQVVAAVQTETAAAIIATQGTATPTPRDSQLPPTWTPAPQQEATLTEAAPEPPPAGVIGSLAMWGGRPNDEGIYDFYVQPISGGFDAASRIGDSRGREIRFAGRGDRVIYTRYFSTTFDFGIELININGTQSRVLQPPVPLLEMGQPDYCEIANRVVFVALPFDTPDPENLQFDQALPLQVFLYDLENDSVLQITSDGASYATPAFSPDCTQVAVIRNDVNSADSGADIYLLDIRNIVFAGGETTPEPLPDDEQGQIVQPLSVTPITNDLGTFTEAAPRWSPDGRQIIYSAASATEPDNGDIFIVNADGSGTPLPVVRSAADDIYPVISPDGDFVTFASNRDGGSYSVYIIRPQDDETWKITPDSAGNFFPGGWWQQ